MPTNYERLQNASLEQTADIIANYISNTSGNTVFIDEYVKIMEWLTASD